MQVYTVIIALYCILCAVHLQLHVLILFGIQQSIYCFFTSLYNYFKFLLLYRINKEIIFIFYSYILTMSIKRLLVIQIYISQINWRGEETRKRSSNGKNLIQNWNNKNWWKASRRFILKYKVNPDFAVTYLSNQHVLSNPTECSHLISYWYSPPVSSHLP